MENCALTYTVRVGDAVGIISTSRMDWSPSMDSSAKIEEETPKLNVRIKGRSDDDILDSCQPSQADWIRKYLEHQEEVPKFLGQHLSQVSTTFSCRS